ncbi:hypothetical protein ABW19_dt0208708 [Dactylella cylindrospora]|nr:hypothetical protein ABW19_dt0208708 [Dactylella cylindrospora]
MSIFTSARKFCLDWFAPEDQDQDRDRELETSREPDSLLVPALDTHPQLVYGPEESDMTRRACNHSQQTAEVAKGAGQDKQKVKCLDEGAQSKLEDKPEHSIHLPSQSQKDLEKSEERPSKRTTKAAGSSSSSQASEPKREADVATKEAQEKMWNGYKSRNSTESKKQPNVLCPKCVKFYEDKDPTKTKNYCLRCIASKNIDMRDVKLQDAARDIRNLKSSLSEKASEMKELQSVVYAQENEISGLRAKLKRLTQEYQRNEMEIAKLQRTELAMNRRGEDLMDEDAKQGIHDIIRTKFQAISRPYFRKIPWKDISGQLEHIEAVDLSQLFFLPWASEQEWLSIRDHPDMSTATFVDMILLSSVIQRIFMPPFFRCDSQSAEGLNRFYFEMLRRDNGAADNWRAQTVTLLNEMIQSDFSADSQESKGDVLQQSLREFGCNLQVGLEILISFDHSPTDAESQELNTKMLDIVNSSAKLADSWRSRPFRLEFIDMHWIKWRGVQWGTDDATKYLTVFPKSKELKDWMHYRIVCVISPGFIRYENREDGMPPQEIVWERASVLLSEVKLITTAQYGDFPFPNNQRDSHVPGAPHENTIVPSKTSHTLGPPEGNAGKEQTETGVSEHLASGGDLHMNGTDRGTDGNSER